MNDTQLLLDKIALAEATATLAFAQDDRDWDAFRSVLAERVHFDLSRHLDMPAADLSLDELVVRAQHALGGFEATQHTVSNLVSTVDGDHATCRAHVVGYHYLPAEPGAIDYCIARNTWRLSAERAGGRWRFTRIVVVRSLPFEGDFGVYERAARRASERLNA